MVKQLYRQSIVPDIKYHSLLEFFNPLPCHLNPLRIISEGDEFLEVRDGFLFPAYVTVGYALVVAGIGMLRVEADGLVVVLDGPLELPQVAVGVAPVVVGRGMLRVEADGRTELSYSLIVASLFSQVYTSVVVPLSRAFRWAASNKDATGNRSHRKQRGNKFSLNRPPPLLLILPMRPSYTNATITGEDCQYQIREYMNFTKSLAAEKGTILTKY